MRIDFHNEANRGTYGTRQADWTWREAMLRIIDPAGKRVADIGCGGGIYSRAWDDLGAAAVIGIDFSAQMIADARSSNPDRSSLSFHRGDAAATGLPDAAVEIVFQRALIHHLPELSAAFREARRILAPGGTLIVQDRTYEDVLTPASPHHLRGYFFETFPRLLEIERDRRPAAATVTLALEQAGFTALSASPLAEVRRQYTSLQELQDDLRARTGRSILHALSDVELDYLIDAISSRVENAFPLDEQDFWTVWTATRPVSSPG